MDEANPDTLFFMAQELGGAGHWADALAVQMGRVLDASWGLDKEKTPGGYHRLRYESYFFLAALRQLLRVCESYRDHTKDDRLHRALDEFRTAVPNAVNFRDWAEHLEEYFAGTGHMQRKGEVAADAAFEIKSSGDRVILHFDGRTLDLLATRDAAADLAGVASSVWMDQLVVKPGPGYRTLRRH